MDKITPREVVAGDILLFNGNSLISKLIRFFDGTEVNHAAIFLGGGQVGEAQAAGLARNTLEDGLKNNEYIIVRRLKTQPGSMQPVLDKASYYLEIGNKYAFEQILILAFLGLTRKLTINFYLKWLMRKILDQATDWLTSHGDRQPMICSEFVYRCYDEALSVAHDPFALDIEPLPPGSVRDVAAAKSLRTEPRRKNIHRDSLLAWVDDASARRGGSAPNLVFNSFERGSVVPSAPATARERKIAEMPLDTLIKGYLKETRKPATRALELESSLRGPELLGSIKNFCDAYYRVSQGTLNKSVDVWFSEKGTGQTPRSLDNMLQTVADFVTPGDLYKCGTLYSVGTLSSKKK